MNSGRSHRDVSFRPAVGAVLTGRYVLDAPIDRGAAGEVWQGKHAAVGRRVAIKILRAEHARDQDDWATKRMLREARLLSEIEHPAIVNVIDYGEEGGCPYIVMEFLEGRTLAAAIREDGAMPWAKAGPLLQQMIEGLDAAHAVGVVHRDLKPANIMLLRDDTRAKVLDFGIAGARGRTRITVDGEVLGTPHFMSPEQSRTMDLTAVSDVYSFGCVAFAMLAGRPPYVGTLPQIVKQHLAGPIPALAERVGSDVPREVCRAIERCMAKDPQRRYASMASLHEGLFGRPLGTARARSTGRRRARVERHRRGVWTAAALGVAIVLGGAGVFAFAMRERPTDPLQTWVPAVRASLAPEPSQAPAAPLQPAPAPVLPVEIARPKQIEPDDDAPRRPVEVRRPRREPPPTPLEPPPQIEPAASSSTAERPKVDKVGGLKNPFDDE